MKNLLLIFVLAFEPTPPLPTSTQSALPTPNGQSYLRRITDKNKGLTYSNGTTWQNVSTPWQVFRLEDFGGVAGDSSPTARANNNTAWTNMQMAMGTPSGGFTATYHVQFNTGTYYFSGPLKFLFSLYVEGAADAFLRPTTTLSFPPTGDGLFIAYDTMDPTYFAGASTVKNIKVTHDQTLAVWQATQSYSHGSAVMPTTAKGWTGYVFINNGSTATSGGSEPVWSTDFPTPTGLNGSNVTDGGITWTATAVSLIDIRANNIDMDNIDAYQGYGNGIFIYGNTTNSLSDGNTFRNVSSNSNLSAGILIRGNDANENKYYNVNALFNCTWGVYDAGFLGNGWFGLDCSFNGPSCKTQYLDAWGPSITPPVGSELVPTVPNGYAYVSAGVGATGLTEPTWPTTLGATVVDGAITWTCHRHYSGGPLLLGTTFGGQVTTLYEEDSGIKTVNNGMITGFGSATAFDSTSTGAYWNGTQHHSQQTFDSPSSDPSHNAVSLIGDQPGDLQFFQWRVLNKDNSAFVSMFGQYVSGFLNWVNGGSSTFMQLPFGNSADGVTGSVYFPNGIGIGTFGSGNTVKEIYANGVPPSPTLNKQGDRAVARLGLYNPGGAGLYTKISDSTGRWEESAWTSPAQGRILEPLSEFGETDLHFLVDDVRTQFNYIFGAPETLLSRKGSYTLTWTNGGANGFNVVTVPQATSADSDIAYDYSRRSRKVVDPSSAGSYGVIASNAAHALPTAGAVTLECMWYSFGTGGANYTLFGYSTTSANAGYQLTVKTDGSLLFSAQNTASAAFVSLNSAASAVTTRQYHLADVVFDTVNNVYQLWLDGVLVASASSTTGTLGTTVTNIGFGGLLTNSATLTQPSSSQQYPSELERTLRALSEREIVDRSKQFRSSNSIASAGDTVNATNITAHSGGGGVGSCTQLAAVGFSRIDTVAVNNDSACLPACAVGYSTKVANKGAHTPLIFPPTGGHIWTGGGATDLGADTPQALSVCGAGICMEEYTCTDGTQWIANP